MEIHILLPLPVTRSADENDAELPYRDGEYTFHLPPPRTRRSLIMVRGLVLLRGLLLRRSLMVLRGLMLLAAGFHLAAWW